MKKSELRKIIKEIITELKLTSKGIKIGDTVKILDINDHQEKKYDVGDTFVVKYILDTGSDNALYAAEDKNYPFHPDDLKIIRK